MVTHPRLKTYMLIVESGIDWKTKLTKQFCCYFFRNCEYFYEDKNILEADAVLFYLHAVRIFTFFRCFTQWSIILELDKYKACERRVKTTQKSRPALGVSQR